ncbi:uncharacterized protein VICG_00657 [Vittaforma corneae ATCC 50505]|uniref:Transcription factor CBF/NF-Y/archaeal histone domain-containing protein n=1 Tax=Vittaforma corneae (strain ATCC 50505) TaxID=993615 RepID=L2GMY6_VITCO|nr:uncharacterized protein VICG_00657 [Vittaforma corneae ATCC 50505]ELA42258.1 hypothetical protein VICG_00657 [Vittaforma corneae ATCC 50505]
MDHSLNDLHKKRKTRFPLSRIKKIMQQNEDVGKAAITVPVVLSKALEMFFEQIISKMAESAKRRESAKIQAQDFRSVVKSNEELYSFLVPLCSTEKEDSQ